MTINEGEGRPDEAQVASIPEAQARRQAELDRLTAEKMRRMDARQALEDEYSFYYQQVGHTGTDNRSCNIPGLDEALRQGQQAKPSTPDSGGNLKSDLANIQAERDRLHVSLETERAEAIEEKTRLDAEVEAKRLKASEELAILDSELEQKRRLLDSEPTKTDQDPEKGGGLKLTFAPLPPVSGFPPPSSTEMPGFVNGYQGTVSLGHPDDPAEIHRDASGDIEIGVPADPYGQLRPQQDFRYTPYEVRLSMGAVPLPIKPFKPE